MPDTSSPPPGCVADGQGWQANGLLDAGEAGIQGVIVGLGAGACPTSILLTAVTGTDGMFAFPGLPAGDYCVMVEPAIPGQPTILTAGRWTYPQAQPAGLIGQTAPLGPGEVRLDLRFGWEEVVAPTPVPPTPAASPTVPVSCTDRAEFVQDVTYPDGTPVSSGQRFVKTWRIRNAGTCTWNQDYSLVFFDGAQMGGLPAQALPGTVAPGQNVDLSVELQAPAAAGRYRGLWKLRNASGALFGIGTNAIDPFWVDIVVGATPTVDVNAWRGEYFANRTLSGNSVLSRNDANLDFNWGRAAPNSAVPADNFSVRWVRQLRFDQGVYRFRLLSDDGARLWVDERLVIDQWSDGAAREASVDLALSRGAYDIRVEYYEHTDVARVSLRWERLADPSYSEWKGEYWFDRALSSRFAILRNDRNIDFDWGAGSPALGIPADNFSARWTRWVTFEPGLYRLNARADDGVRVLVDGVLAIDEWHDSGGSTTYSAQLPLSGSRQLQVIYYEHGGAARVRFWWERVGVTTTPTATSTSTASATPTSTAAASPTPTATPTPTSTITATASPTPTATPTPTPTATVAPAPQVVYDFVQGACMASWWNGTDVLPCPGVVGDPAGYVIQLTQVSLETGEASPGLSLVTQPLAQDGGIIEGAFPPFTLQGGERFQAVIGCQNGQTECSVLFGLSYMGMEEAPRAIASWPEVYDGSLTVVDVDLSSLTGQTVSLILSVDGKTASSQDAAVWVQARLLR